MTGKAKVLALLSDFLHHSHHEGYAMNVMLHSRVADLRRDGYVIECVRRDGMYWYRLLSKPGPAQGPPLRGEREAHEANGAAVTDGASSDAAVGVTLSPQPTAAQPALFDMPVRPVHA